MATCDGFSLQPWRRYLEAFDQHLTSGSLESRERMRAELRRAAPQAPLRLVIVEAGDGARRVIA